MIDVIVCILPGAQAASVAITLDVLRAAAALAPRCDAPVPRWRVVSPDGGTVALAGGLSCDSVALPRGARDSQAIWVLPGLGVADPTRLQERLASTDAQRLVRALVRHHARGGQMAASCASVFLLQEAGLLQGRRVTTSWWLAHALQRVAPDCIVDADRMLCVDGPLVTAGAAMAQTDLMLWLLRDRFGARLSDLVARMLLLDQREAQTPFVLPAMLAGGDALVDEVMRRIEAALPNPPGVATLAEALAMSPRTLHRHIRAATGRGPRDLIQIVRLNHARRLLENSRMTIEQIAAQVGYDDATALRRLMRRRMGATPTRFRERVAASTTR